MERPRTGAQRTAGAQGITTAPSTASVAGHPIHPMLVPFPIALLVGGLLADIGYLVTDDAFFARMAAWLIGAGLLAGAVAAVPGAVDFFSVQRARRSRAGVIHAVGNAAALVLAVANLALRLMVGVEEAIAFVGVALSALTAALLAVTGWFGGELSYRLLVGADPPPDGTPPPPPG